MDKIMSIAEKYGLIVIEDAAQGIMCTYKNKPLGSIGHLGALSFHETKNIISGEGGALLINEPQFIERAEIIREKGTNRSQFFRGEVDRYTWVDIGSSYLPSDIVAAFLYAQMNAAQRITEKKMQLWRKYWVGLRQLERDGFIELPVIPEKCTHNAHLFYLKTRGLEERNQLINHLNSYGVQSVFHYVPLHSAKAGRAFGRFCGEDIYTTRESERLLRLPLFPDLKEDEVDKINEIIYQFYQKVYRNRPLPAPDFWNALSYLRPLLFKHQAMAASSQGNATAGKRMILMKKKVAIIQSNYIPWKGYFDILMKWIYSFSVTCILSRTGAIETRSRQSTGQSG